MEGERNFSTPEEEIAYLEQKILEKKKEMGERGPQAVVRDAIQEHASAVPVPPPPAPASDQSAVSDPTDAYVETLVKTAFESGVLNAVAKARATHNPHIIDAFHDALTDRFVDALRAKGLLDQ